MYTCLKVCAQGSGYMMGTRLREDLSNTGPKEKAFILHLKPVQETNLGDPPLTSPQCRLG